MKGDRNRKWQLYDDTDETLRDSAYALYWRQAK